MGLCRECGEFVVVVVVIVGGWRVSGIPKNLSQETIVLDTHPSFPTSRPAAPN